MQNKPHDDDLLLMAQLQTELERDHLTLEERRGKEVLLRNMKEKFDINAIERAAHLRLAMQFDPDYKPQPRAEEDISPELRAERNAYRNRMQARVQK